MMADMTRRSCIELGRQRTSFGVRRMCWWCQ